MWSCRVLQEVMRCPRICGNFVTFTFCFYQSMDSATTMPKTEFIDSGKGKKAVADYLEAVPRKIDCSFHVNYLSTQGTEHSARCKQLPQRWGCGSCNPPPLSRAERVRFRYREMLNLPRIVSNH
jgi:hypothetical protein